MNPYLRVALTGLMDIAFPARCGICEKGPSTLCSDCLRRLRADGGLAPRATRRGDLEGLRLTVYSRECSALLASVKERGQTSVWGALSPEIAALGKAVAQRWPGASLISVPSSRGAMRRRGVNPAELLCQRVARAAHLPVVGGLKLVRQPRDQATLGQAERAANLRDSMSFTPPRDFDGELIIFDDVVTTGATILEASRAIRAAVGAPLVAGFCVFAETLRNRSPGEANGSMFSPQATKP